MTVKEALSLAYETVALHESKASRKERVAINALCNLYGSALVASKWYRLQPIVKSNDSIGRILSAAITTMKRGA